MQSQERPEASHADPHGREAICLRDLRQTLWTRQRTSEPHEDPHGQETRREARLQRVRQEIPLHGQSQVSHERAYGGKAVRLRSVRQEIQQPEQSEDAHDDALRGKDAQLQHLWQEVHAALQPEAAQAGARGRTAISLRRLWENFHNQQRVQDPSEGSPAGGRTGADWKNCRENLKHSVRSLLVLVIGLNLESERMII